MNAFQFKTRYPTRRPKAFIYAIAGESVAFREDIVHQIRQRYRPDDLAYQRAHVTNQAQALKVLSLQPTKGFRLVELTDFDQWPETDLLAQWVSTRVYPNIIPVFISASRAPSTKTPFAKAIIRNGWWVVCYRPSREQMQTFLGDKFRLPIPAADAMIDVVGTDLHRIQTLIEKLKFMTDGKLPTRADVEEAALGYVSTIFALTDAIFDRRKTRAMALAPGASTRSVLSLLRRRTEQLIKVRAIARQQPDPRYVSEQTGVPLFLVTSAIEKAKTVSLDRAAQILSLIAQAEIDLTIRRFNDEVVLRRLIIEL